MKYNDFIIIFLVKIIFLIKTHREKTFGKLEIKNNKYNKENKVRHTNENLQSIEMTLNLWITKISCFEIFSLFCIIIKSHFIVLSKWENQVHFEAQTVTRSKVQNKVNTFE